MKKEWKIIDDSVKQGLLVDPNLNAFLQPVFPVRSERYHFIKDCLKKTKIRRMLLRAQWYTEIAEDQKRTRHNRPALQIVFLMGMAESIAKAYANSARMRPAIAAQSFFKLTTKPDKQLLERKFRRTLLGPKHHTLRFSSIVKILYEIRNKAVHGEDYYSFSLMDVSKKEKYQDYTHYGLITSATLGKGKSKRRVSLDLSLTYPELRDIFRRTAIEHIKLLL